MKISYKSNKLERNLSFDKALLKNYGRIAKKLKQRKNELESWPTLHDISKLPALRLHPLQGNKEGIWSVDIHKNWRILFEIDEDPIPLLEDGGIDLTKVYSICIASIEDTH